MNVRNCRGCGRLFNYLTGVPICPACKDALESKFQKVKEFLRENPNSSIQVVAEENEVSIQQIKQWVRDERLTFGEDSMMGVDCECCGKTIRTGRFCDECKYRMKNDLNSVLYKPKVFEEEKPKSSRERDKMRFLDK